VLTDIGRPGQRVIRTTLAELDTASVDMLSLVVVGSSQTRWIVDRMVTPAVPEQLVTITISADCTACGSCLITCPEGALEAAPGRPAVSAGACTDCLACIEVCPVDAITLPAAGPGERATRPAPIHPIEAQSYAIMETLVDLAGWPKAERAIVARMIHATADESFASSAVSAPTRSRRE